MDENRFLELFYNVEVIGGATEEDVNELAGIIGPIDAYVSVVNEEKIGKIMDLNYGQRARLKREYTMLLAAETANVTMEAGLLGLPTSYDTFVKVYREATKTARILVDKFFRQISPRCEEHEMMYQ